MANDYLTPDDKQINEIVSYLEDSDKQEAGSAADIPFNAVSSEKLKTMPVEELKILASELSASLETTKEDGRMMKVASAYGNTQMPYSSPFMNLSDTKIPRSTSDIFKWCKYYYMFDPLISGAINALSTFPITDMYLEENKIENGKKTASGDESDNLKFYKRMLFDELNLIDLLIGMGVDYHLYGNVIVFGTMTKDEVSGKIKWQHVIRLDPSRIVIDYNPITQEKKYKWLIPDKIAKICNDKKPKAEYDKIPDVIKASVRDKKAVLLNSDNIYHIARTADSSGDNAIWGIPVIANVMKLLMYRTILRQAQEAIAREHIVPMRIFYVQQMKGFDPMGDWTNVAQNLSREIQKSVRDPNYKVVSPVPIGLQNVGGEGRALLLTAEIEQVQNEILAGMNVPREFIFGGVSYSGSSIALKILENQFITYRLKLKDFCQNFLIKKIAKANNEWLNDADDDEIITLKMVDMRMQDDVQQKQLIIDLNSRGKVSDEYLWKIMGLDPDKTRDALKVEAENKLKSDFELQSLQEEYNFKLQKLQLKHQAELQKLQAQMMPETPGAQDDMGGQGRQQLPPQNQDGNQPQQMQPPPQQTEEQQNSDEQQFVEVAKQLMALPKNQQEKMLGTLPQQYQQAVMQIMQQLEMEKEQNKSKIDMRPMPEKKPPRRDSLK